MWDPDTYLVFDDHRARPFHDLVARVGATAPRRVVDLGCGPGTLTATLNRRWPQARIEALDNSPEMVAAARERGVGAALADVGEWSPQPDTDVVVCNAVLQWVPGHEGLLQRWLGELSAGSWLAFQVPDNLTEPSHAEVRALAAEHPWAGLVDLREPDAVLTPREYAALLTAAGADADVWETTYLHRMTGADPVLEWITGTALRPVRAVLSERDWAACRAELAPRLRAAYPVGEDGLTWFPFRRIFAVARLP